MFCTLISVLFGVSARRFYCHAIAKNALRKLGFDCHHQFEEPIGPNWLYGVSGVPENGTFPYWFSSRFCCTGYWNYIIKNASPSISDLNSFRNLVEFRGLTISKSSMPAGWISVLGDCNYLENLEVNSTALAEEDMSDLAQLNVRSLRICRSKIKYFELFKASVQRMPSLVELRLSETGLSHFQIEELEKLIPCCTEY